MVVSTGYANFKNTSDCDTSGLGNLELLDLKSGFRSMLDKIPSAEYEKIDDLIKEIEMNAHDILSKGHRADAIDCSMIHHAVDSSETWKYVNFEQYLTQRINLSYSTFRPRQKSLEIQLETIFESEIGSVELYPNEFAQAFRNDLKNTFKNILQRKVEAEGDYFPNMQIEVKQMDEFVWIPLVNNGLRLSITDDVIVQRHQGRINVESELDKYTKLTIDVPLEDLQKTK